MMNNATNEISQTNNLFRRYLLGESIKNIFIRLTVILSAITLVWCGIMFALIIHMKCQRTKQMLKTSNTHHHLYDSSTSLTKKRSNCSKRNRRFHSSSSSLSSTRCYSIRHILSQLKSHCIFWPRSTVNDNSINRSLSLNKRKKQMENQSKNSYSTPNKVQLVVESMTKQSLTANHNTINIGKKISLYHQTTNSSEDKLKNLYLNDNKSKTQTEIPTPHISNLVQLVSLLKIIFFRIYLFFLDRTKKLYSSSIYFITN